MQAGDVAAAAATPGGGSGSRSKKQRLRRYDDGCLSLRRRVATIRRVEQKFGSKRIKKMLGVIDLCLMAKIVSRFTLPHVAGARSSQHIAIPSPAHTHLGHPPAAHPHPASHQTLQQRGPCEEARLCLCCWLQLGRNAREAACRLAQTHILLRRAQETGAAANARLLGCP